MYNISLTFSKTMGITQIFNRELKNKLFHLLCGILCSQFFKIMFSMDIMTYYDLHVVNK